MPKPLSPEAQAFRPVQRLIEANARVALLAKFLAAMDSCTDLAEARRLIKGYFADANEQLAQAIKDSGKAPGDVV